MSSQKGICLVVSAPSGGGKTTIIRAMLARSNNLYHSISYTTRPPRNEVQDLNDYHFISDDKFDRMIADNAFLEWAEVHGFKYGTSREDLFHLLEAGHDVVLDIDVQGSLQLMETFREAAFVFIVPPSKHVLETRLRKRQSETDETLSRRLSNAINEVRHYLKYDYIVINDRLDDAIAQTEAIMVAEKLQVDREEVRDFITDWLEGVEYER